MLAITVIQPFFVTE